jgi:hypothetical protein
LGLYLIAAIVKEKDLAEEGETHATQQLRIVEVAMVTLLNEQPLVDKNSGMVILAKIETAGGE